MGSAGPTPAACPHPSILEGGSDSLDSGGQLLTGAALLAAVGGASEGQLLRPRGDVRGGWEVGWGGMRARSGPGLR